MAQYWCLFHCLLLILLSYKIHAQSFNSSVTNVSTSWVNNPFMLLWKQFDTGPEIRIIINLIVDPTDEHSLKLAFGFYRGDNHGDFLLAVVLYYDGPYTPELVKVKQSQVLWSSNRNIPIRENCTLNFTEEGDLILRDIDDTLIWSTNTSGRSIVGLQMTKMGNLVLFDQSHSTIWQSFDHPNDILVLGQKLVEGQKLVAWTSPTNWTDGLYSLSVKDDGLYAFYDSNPPLYYYQNFLGKKISKQPSFVEFENGSLSFYILDPGSGKADERLEVPQTHNFQYMQLGSDGHLRAYDWNCRLEDVSDLLSSRTSICNYPEVCGNYGICLDGQCSCPDPDYFRQINDRKPELGCAPKTPLSCETSQYHHLLHLNDLMFSNTAMDGLPTNLESCKQACLRNCSCKLASFERYNEAHGLCFLQSNIISLSAVEASAGWSVHIKVQGFSPAPPPKFHQQHANGARIFRILGSVAGVFVLIAISFLISRMGRSLAHDHSFEGRLSQIPTRFCYKKIKKATGNFCTKLGEGGFGSVYKGTLVDGTEIAVKRLDRLGQVKESFLAEVETIGHIHHINLVRLIGFCAHKSHRLLVYEYMCNGSLDKWIFEREPGESLVWKTRQKIITDLAKGLAYLHEDCQPRILHLDIKPKNILIDEKFNAKVSDFGLSKLMEKDQSKVITALRGTPGYMAPEWLGFVITDKVDVYSFGIVVLEILCGRKIFDSSKSEQCMHLLNVLEKKAEDGQLHDMIDDQCQDMKQHEEEVLKMIKLSAWCLQIDLSRRPSMSMVVKVLDGLTDIEPNLEYKFIYTAPSNFYIPRNKGKIGDTSPLFPSVLSGPR